MKHLFTPIVTTLLILLGMTVSVKQPSHAQGSSTFFCDTDGEVPITVARNEWGNKPMISWTSHRGGLTPEERCQIVSSRFQLYYKRGWLKYIRSGNLNNYPVVCVARYKGGPCEGVLITLSSQQEAEFVRQQIVNSGYLTVGLELGNNQPVYFDMEEFLREDPINVKNPPFIEQ